MPRRPRRRRPTIVQHGMHAFAQQQPEQRRADPSRATVSRQTEAHLLHYLLTDPSHSTLDRALNEVRFCARCHGADGYVERDNFQHACPRGEHACPWDLERHAWPCCGAARRDAPGLVPADHTILTRPWGQMGLDEACQLLPAHLAQRLVIAPAAFMPNRAQAFADAVATTERRGMVAVWRFDWRMMRALRRRADVLLSGRRQPVTLLPPMATPPPGRGRVHRRTHADAAIQRMRSARQRARLDGMGAVSGECRREAPVPARTALLAGPTRLPADHVDAIVGGDLGIAQVYLGWPAWRQPPMAMRPPLAPP